MLGRLLFLTAALVFSAITHSLAWDNADIFPAAPAAEKSVTWKDGYFWINGKPTYLTAGEMHYARIPKELWRDRIWRAKELGFNCVQMYVFWNATEGKEGQWDFSDNLDLDAWLTAIQDAGMYAVVRVGPYSCAEWEQGGFPAWLTAKPGMTLRDSGADFDKYAFQHLDQVEKIVAAHQINHGGNVIMVQLENEHPRGWGMDDKDPYLGHLVDQAQTNGLEVPMFLSGLHHGNDPAGEEPFKPGNSPWFTTEFWTGWIGRYGDMDPGMLEQKIAGTWKIIGFGGAGYDYYVVHGGTNFGYSGFTHEATYDYSAPIGESGKFNNFYAPAKRAAYFAQSFSSLLTGSHDDPTLAKADAPQLRVSIRTNPEQGSLILLDNFQKKKGSGGQIAPDASAYKAPDAVASNSTPTHLTIGTLTLPHQGAINVASTEPRTVLVNVPWTANASFESVCTNVLLRQTLGDTDYWVVYGEPGDTGEITLTRKDHGSTPTNFTYPTDSTVQEVALDSGDGHRAMVLVMNKELTARTWLAHDRILIGPSFVLEDGSLEFPPEGGHATIYSAQGKSEISQAAATPPDLPALDAWSWRDAAAERSSDLAPAQWQTSQGPQPIGAIDSFQNRYAWYRTTLHRDASGTTSLHLAGGPGESVAFLNGQPVASLGSLPTQAGDNSLAILCKAEPRSTLWLRTGPIGDSMNRGLWGGISTDSASTPATISWTTWKGQGEAGKSEEVSKPSHSDANWEPVDEAALPEFAKHRDWLRGTFTLDPDQVDSFILSSDFEKWKSTVYLNGQLLTSLEGDLSKTLVPGANVILVEPDANGGDLHHLTLDLWKNSSVAHATWYFHGGLHGLDETPIIGRVTNWDSFLSSEPWLKDDQAVAGLPAFWRTTFSYHPPADLRQTVGLTTEGLKTGHVWLNGHNLGECPQKVPLYVPECWLKDGDNDLVVFDLYGNKPDKVRFTRYEDFAIQAGPKP